MIAELNHHRKVCAPERGEAGLTPEEAVRQRIIDHLQDAALESPRLQAFADYTDLQNSLEWLPGPNRVYNPDMVRETTRQRMNGWNGYKGEYQEVETIVSEYRRICKDTTSNPPLAQVKLAQFLMEIKNQEVERKSQRNSRPA